jgi:hypothetical protein
MAAGGGAGKAGGPLTHPTPYLPHIFPEASPAAPGTALLVLVRDRARLVAWKNNTWAIPSFA